MIKDFPEIRRSNESWDIDYNNQEFPSDLNRAIQTKAMPGAKWKASLTFANRMGKEARILQGFVTGLQGAAGRFWITPTDWKPLGSAVGEGSLSAPVGQFATTITTTGWEPHQPELLYTGDFFEINGELKRATSISSADANGHATIEFCPPTRVALPAGTQIRTEYPRSQMKLATNTAGWNLSAPVVYGMTLDIEEALDI
ncbi:hypothetical protein [Marinobacter sp. BGYM27]|uniref:hypothetical protein n=1 Tax=Marinobacter sp. BGYM27 TaxID=2975597 RepID=UPI0021A38D5D|nr:hypothetical protein [Marinobacter sp. BGYM27]MDG5498974.1 hypothetical protein [Marinobacter sp. BGYM27]